MAELWCPSLDCNARVLLGPTVPVDRHTQLGYDPRCGSRGVHLYWLPSCG